MAGLVEDILACLQGAGGSAGGGPQGSGSSASSGVASGGGGGGSDAPYPAAWLLLDLQELLPPGSSLAAKLQCDEGSLCKELERVSVGDAAGKRHAAKLAGRCLQEISRDAYSSRQLAEVMAQNPSMFQLCLQGLRRADSAAAASAISDAAWQVFSAQAAVLQAATGSLPDGERLVAKAAASAIVSLNVATQVLSICSRQLLRAALLQHGASIADSLRAAISEAAASSLDGGGKAQLAHLLMLWAEQGPAVAGGGSLDDYRRLCRPCLAIAGLYLDAALPKLLSLPPSVEALLPNGPAAKLASVLRGVHSCAAHPAAERVYSAGSSLLRRHAPALAELAASYLSFSPPPAAPAGSGGKAAARAEQAAAALYQLTWMACEAARAAAEQRATLPAQSAAALESVVRQVVAGQAPCLAWVPEGSRSDLDDLGCKALCHLFAAARPPPPQLPQRASAVSTAAMVPASELQAAAAVEDATPPAVPPSQLSYAGVVTGRSQQQGPAPDASVGLRQRASSSEPRGASNVPAASPPRDTYAAAARRAGVRRGAQPPPADDGLFKKALRLCKELLKL